jgi:hypothetical protein
MFFYCCYGTVPHPATGTRTINSPVCEKKFMQSEVKWGIGLIVIGIILIPVLQIAYPLPLVATLYFTVPPIVIGIALIAFRGREAVIEGVQEEQS